MAAKKCVLGLIVLALVSFGLGANDYNNEESQRGLILMGSAFFLLLVSLLVNSIEPIKESESVLIPFVQRKTASKTFQFRPCSECETCEQELPIPDESRAHYIG